MVFTIPEDELRFRATRAGGPGGQHVNKSSTRVEVWWNVGDSPSLTAQQRQRLLQRLSARIDSRGVLRVVSGARRSQLRNREEAVQRINEIVRAALRVPKRRRKTRPPRRAVESRLADKRRRGEKKESRKKVEGDE